MARQKKADGTKEVDPILAEIKELVGEITNLDEELSELKAEVKTVSGKRELAWKRLLQLNAEQTRTYPLLEGKEGESTPEPEPFEAGKAQPEPPPQATEDLSPAAPEGYANWRTVPVSDLERFGLTKKLVATLVEGGVGTIGDISKLGDNHLSLTDVKGVGEKAAEKINAALDGFWKAWGPADEVRAGEAEAASPEAEADPTIGPTSGLTDDQVRELAQRLEGSKADARDAAKAIFGVDVSDGIVAHLHATAGMLKCHSCGEWKESADFPIDETGGSPIECFECLNADASGGE